MGLPMALQAHQQGDTKKALIHYKRALEQGVTTPHLFQNYGALIRSQSHSSALEIYNKGLELYPDHLGIRKNRANLYHSSSPANAIADLLILIRLKIVKNLGAQCVEDFVNLLFLCSELSLFNWSLSIAKYAIGLIGPRPQILAQLILLFDDPQFSYVTADGFDISELMLVIEKQIDACEPIEQAELRLALAMQDATRGDISLALERFEAGLSTLTNNSPTNIEDIDKYQKIIDLNSWNFGCTLLKAQQLSKGWQLYEYGLRTPAEGPQRWQRALVKPFAASELPMWNGESLSGKRLLLLEEQAIGDVMMFLTLIPSLLREAKSLGIMVSDRLKSIYDRRFSDVENVQVWTHKSALNGSLDTSQYDLQIPLASICQYRFLQPFDYACEVPMLKPKQERMKSLRLSYATASNCKAQRIIGVSWRGGGRPGRIRQKSITPDQFFSLIKPISGVRFVSLQYGKVSTQIDEWRRKGSDIIHDPRVDPLRDMDLWLDQVAACDAVVSVANTTIHGAGSLNVPTLCLLSITSDWRWFVDEHVTRSYWYPCVGIERENKSNGWHQALSNAREWIEGGSKMPTGPISS